MTGKQRFDSGGKMPSGLQEVVNKTEKPERIIKPPHSQDEFTKDEND